MENPRDLSTFELLVPERSCMKSDTLRSYQVTMKAWEGLMVGYEKDSKTYRF